MGDAPLVRFWTPTIPGFRFADLGLEYLRALGKSDLQVRAISTTGGHIDAKTPWGEVESLFITPHGDGRRLVNVVCSDQVHDLQRLWTKDALNVALTGVGKARVGLPVFSAALKQYTTIAAVSQIDHDTIRELTGLSLWTVTPADIVLFLHRTIKGLD